MKYVEPNVIQKNVHRVCDCASWHVLDEHVYTAENSN